MKKDVKTDILETARKLFNEQGYNGVSMRDIAGALGISVGNLTYYFKRKEDLLEAVALRQVEGYQKKAPAASLAELDGHFRRKLAFQKGNAYYFRHYTQLAQISPKVYEMQRGIIRDQYEFYGETFRGFKSHGRMMEDTVPGQTRHLIQALVTVSLFGTAMGEPDGERLPCFWSLIWPMLTETGRREYREEVERRGGV